MSARSFILVSFVLLSILGCGKNVELGSGEGSSPRTANPPGTPPIRVVPADCASAQEVRWRFVQPDPSISHAVDLLLVVDTSDSLEAERSRLASTLPTFIQHLPQDADTRIAVMLAHGGASSYSGRLYGATGVPRVLDPSLLSRSTMEADLQKTLAKPPGDKDEANGEAMMYSLMKSLDPSRLAEIQGQGFYRPDAALSVVFVTDENDVCYPPELFGYTTFPDYVPSASGIEARAYRKYCLDSSGHAKITPADTLARMSGFKSTQLLSWGAILHKDPAKVPAASASSEDAIGHGILELLAGARDSISWEIADSSYADGMARLGDVTTRRLDLKTHFVLDGTGSLESVRAEVDGAPVDSGFDSSGRAVDIAPSDAGHAGSVVEVIACQK